MTCIYLEYHTKYLGYSLALKLQPWRHLPPEVIDLVFAKLIGDSRTVVIRKMLIW